MTLNAGAEAIEIKILNQKPAILLNSLSHLFMWPLKLM